MYSPESDRTRQCSYHHQRYFVIKNQGNPVKANSVMSRWVKLPRQIVSLMLPANGKLPTGNKAKFKVPPSMGKFDIKEYLNKVYDLPKITKIHTVNYDGQLKRVPKRKGDGYKLKRTKAYKTAYVYFDTPLGTSEDSSVAETTASEVK